MYRCLTDGIKVTGALTACLLHPATIYYNTWRLGGMFIYNPVIDTLWLTPPVYRLGNCFNGVTGPVLYGYQLVSTLQHCLGLGALILRPYVHDF